MNKTVWDDVLHYWPVTLYLPAVLILLGVLVVVIGAYDRSHEPRRAAAPNRPVAPGRAATPRPGAGGGVPPVSSPR
jgi:hypothetical protein